MNEEFFTDVLSAKSPEVTKAEAPRWHSGSTAVTIRARRAKRRIRPVAQLGAPAYRIDVEIRVFRIRSATS